ncbi:MAG: RNA methyltransferase [Desulfobacula sp.]|nr:RNA methyltransferase [Desulfobacula sp.]
MDTFGFTKKKFLSKSHENRQRHIIKWLSSFYQVLTANRVNEKSLAFFTDQYNQILNWTGMQTFIRPESNTTRLWIEAVSDQIHFHRTCTGQKVRDYDLIEKIQTKDSSFPDNQIDINCHLALDGMRSLFNVGSIFRTCEAAGFNSIILGSTPGKEHPGVQKTAMGAHKWIDQVKTDDLAQTLLDKKAKGFQIIGVETVNNCLPYHDHAWQKKTIVVFGNEEYGISSHVMATCDQFVHIPMFGRKNSLNVANAVAVVCCHITGYLRI